MLKKIKVSIPSPCDKSWNSFRPTAGGGFCGSCQKEVIDFTSWKEKDIYHFLANRQQKTCGRFRPEQLRSYAAQEVPAGSGYKSYFLGLLGLLTFFSAKEAGAQTALPFVTEQHPENISKKQYSPPADTLKNPEKAFTLQGTVFDKESSEGLPGATVRIKGTKTGVNTDINGAFQLTVAGNENDEVILEVWFIGYETDERAVILQQESQDIGTISLIEDVHVLGELVVVRKWSPRWLWWQVRSIF